MVSKGMFVYSGVATEFFGLAILCVLHVIHAVCSLRVYAFVASSDPLIAALRASTSDVLLCIGMNCAVIYFSVRQCEA